MLTRIRKLTAALCLLAAITAHADEETPFRAGTEAFRLSEPQRESLLEYVRGTTERLKRVLREAEGKTTAAKLKLYSREIIASVTESFEEKRRSELLMRRVLNQALELTTGIPDGQGRTQASRGVLEGSSNQALLTQILEESIHLALAYAGSDEEAARKSSLLDLPYAAMAHERLQLVRFKWLPAVLEWDRQYALSAKALNQWGNTVHSAEEQHQVRYASEIRDADEWLKAELDHPPAGEPELQARTRVLRGRLRQLVERMAGKVDGVAGGGSSSVLTNRLDMKFVWIPAGTFMMGSPDSEAGRDPDEVLHPVTLTHGFEIQTTEVTQAQYVERMKRNPSYFQTQAHCGDAYRESPEGVGMCPGHPVENVSWQDAQDLASELNSWSQDGYVYRLPTEAEWEYASRYRPGKPPTATPYFFGGDASQLSRYAWYGDYSGGMARTHEVAQKEPSAAGLYDLYGNVAEWVQDRYSFFMKRAAATDPLVTTGDSIVAKGGDYRFNEFRSRSAYRARFLRSEVNVDLGFRLVRTRVDSSR